MTSHIGIVACSAEGAALCYTTICVEGAQFLGPHDHPEVSMHTHSLGDYMKCIDRDDWRGVGELMLDSAQKLASIGAEFLICPDNTIHRGLAHVLERSPLPWLHIAEVVAAEAVARGFRRAGLTGTRWLVESEIYPEKLAVRGLDFVVVAIGPNDIGWSDFLQYCYGVEDCADALAWLHRHAAEYGGDPERLYVGGHSAGGHLAAMLALRPEILTARGLPRRVDLTWQQRLVVDASAIADADGTPRPQDCDDTNADVHAGASTVFLRHYCTLRFCSLRMKPSRNKRTLFISTPKRHIPADGWNFMGDGLRHTRWAGAEPPFFGRQAS